MKNELAMLKAVLDIVNILEQFPEEIQYDRFGFVDNDNIDGVLSKLYYQYDPFKNWVNEQSFTRDGDE